jgi:hypothetical protein
VHPNTRWLFAFLFTQAVEVPIYARALAGTRWARHALLIAFGASAITHPIVWFVIPHVWSDLYLALMAPHPALQLSRLPHYVAMAILAEAFAVAAETIYLGRFVPRRALVWSLSANAASLTLGLLSRAAFGLP